MNWLSSGSRHRGRDTPGHTRTDPRPSMEGRSGPGGIVEEKLPAVPLSCRTAQEYIASGAFQATPQLRLGIEAEFFVLDGNDPQRVPGPDELRAALGVDGPDYTFTRGSRLTFEPGGQLELSAPPADDAPGAIAGLVCDLDEVVSRLANRDLTLSGGGVEASRIPYRWVHGSRYDAMAAHFEACGPASSAAGAVMMTATAALQVNLDAGIDEREMVTRWRRAHTVAPVLAAMFACSPVLSGRRTGAVSTRLQAWQDLDRCRTMPVPDVGPALAPRAQWARYALASTVFLVPDESGGHRVAEPFTLAEWIEDPARAGRAALTADIDYHLTTLFPPIRPRGFLELRYLDGQRLEDWPVAVMVVAAVHDDPIAAARAAEACAPVAAFWVDAAHSGLAHEGLGAAATEVMDAALDSLKRTRVSADLVAAVESFAERCTYRSRCPADELLPVDVS